MDTIHIKFAGPVTDTGVVPLTSVMLIMGKQSSGKSTFLKILCFCRWLEKQIMVSSEDIIPQYTHNLRFLKALKQFYRFSDTFFTNRSYIRYESDVLSITMDDASKNVKILRKPDFESLKYNTKLSFIPSERNLVSAVRNIDKSYRSVENDILFNYIFEWGEAKENFKEEHPKRLSFSPNMEYVNREGNDYIRLLDTDEFIASYYASSGVQSAMPVDVMVDYLTGLVGKTVSVSKHDLTNTLLRYLGREQEMNSETVENLKNKLVCQSVQLFIEEPEQNLYPDSQRNLILSTIADLKRAMARGEKSSILVMTTHSPYLLSILNVLIAESYAYSLYPYSRRLKKIIHDDCLLPLDSYSAYCIQEDGSFTNAIDKDVTMISGIGLDSVSDWVEEQIARINEVLYGEKE